MTMKRILLLFLLFCGGYVHAQELDSARIHYRQGHREVDMLFRDNRAELERFIRTLREEHGADRLESVVIRSWASPEGVNRLNVRAQGRLPEILSRAPRRNPRQFDLHTWRRYCVGHAAPNGRRLGHIIQGRGAAYP